LNVVVDTPKGSRNKYKLDEKRGVWRLSKILPEGMSFRYDFGYLPGTRGEDGDPVDVLLLMDAPAFAGCVVPARLIGVFEAEQTEGGKTVRNDRLVAVVETPYNAAEYRSLEEVNEQRLDEIEHFFIAYNHAEGREFKPLARRGADHAAQVLGEAIEGGGHSRNGRKRTRGRGKSRLRRKTLPAPHDVQESHVVF
jgi:inorganic pyrophosphatase